MGNRSDKTLLIVDDSPIIVERLLETLKDHECVKTILTATDVAQAIELMTSKSPNVVMLDIHIGDENGIDLLKTIVQDFKKVKVIMFSNSAEENYVKLCMQIGASHFLDKSKDFELVPGILAKI